MARNEKKKNLPKAGYKIFGHRSHVNGNRMKLDKDNLVEWSKKLERELKNENRRSFDR